MKEIISKMLQTGLLASLLAIPQFAQTVRPEQAGQASPPVTIDFRDIASEAGRLDRIVSDLVVLSQSERGVLDSVCEPMGLRHVLERVVEEETRRWAGGEKKKYAPPPPPGVHAEQTKL